MLKGLLIALLSMALWGLIFVLPMFVPEFSSFEVAMGRFISYGTVSLLYLALKGNLKKLPFSYWKQAAVFALTSSLVYYFFIVIGIRCMGASFATAFCSFLPVMLSIYGNYRNKVYPWRSLIIPLTCLTLGLSAMHVGNLNASESGEPLTFLFGLTAVLLAQAMWAWYSINNADFLTKNPQVPSSLWSSFMGVFCLIGGGLGMAAVMLTAPQACYMPLASKNEILTYLGISFVNGFCASWLTLFLWNRASRQVPMAVLGQMGVFEVLFGLFYYYLIIGSWPTKAETAGVALILAGLFISFRRFAGREAAPT
jgi:drug/metabolite transporter (DMT)-like permease